jgi:hypothetical protein
VPRGLSSLPGSGAPSPGLKLGTPEAGVFGPFEPNCGSCSAPVSCLYRRGSTGFAAIDLRSSCSLQGSAMARLLPEAAKVL